jgi:hypothetical protein
LDSEPSNSWFGCAEPVLIGLVVRTFSTVPAGMTTGGGGVGSGVGATGASDFLADSGGGISLYEAVGLDSLAAGGALAAGAPAGGFGWLGAFWLAALSVAAGLAAGCGDWFCASLALSVRQPKTNSRIVNWAASSKAFERMAISPIGATILSVTFHSGAR